MTERLRAYLIAIRNILIGGNLISLSLICSPNKLVGTISTLLFYFRTLAGKGRLEQQNPDDVLSSGKRYDIKIETGHYFWRTDPSYAKDIVTLCILAKLLNAKVVFEIGTLDGCTAFHLAMNTLKMRESTV